MKFLVIGRPRDGAPKLENPLEVSRAAQASIQKALKDGSFDCCYNLVSGGGVSISNAKSHEELWENLRSYPLYTQLTWEVLPLVDIKYVFDKLVASAEKAKP